MAEERAFAGLAWNPMGRWRAEKRFLAEMNAVIPCDVVIRLIDPHYPKAGRSVTVNHGCRPEHTRSKSLCTASLAVCVIIDVFSR